MVQPSVMDYNNQLLDYNNPPDNINVINIYPGCPDRVGEGAIIKYSSTHGFLLNLNPKRHLYPKC